MGKAFRRSRPSPGMGEGRDRRSGDAGTHACAGVCQAGSPGGPAYPRALPSPGHAEGPPPSVPARDLVARPSRSPRRRSAGPHPCHYLRRLPGPPGSPWPARRCSGSPAPRPAETAAPAAELRPPHTGPRRPVIGCQGWTRGQVAGLQA